MKFEPPYVTIFWDCGNLGGCNSALNHICNGFLSLLKKYKWNILKLMSFGVFFDYFILLGELVAWLSVSICDEDKFEKE